MKDSTEFVPVLHVRSPAFDPHALLVVHPEIKPFVVWTAGEPFLRGRTHSDSGFKLDLGSGPNSSKVVRRCVATIGAITPVLRKAKRAGATIMLDIGVMPDARWFYVNTHFTPGDLAVLSKAGVALCVSSYAPNEPERPSRGSSRRRPRSKQTRGRRS